MLHLYIGEGCKDILRIFSHIANEQMQQYGLVDFDRDHGNPCIVSDTRRKVDLDSGKTFTSAELNVNLLHQMKGTLSVIVDFLSGNSEQESSESFLAGNGSNWVGILATGSDVIKSISMAISDPASPDDLIIQDTRQIRLGGIGDDGGNNPPPIAIVPEPISIVGWLLAGAYLMSVALRQSRQAAK